MGPPAGRGAGASGLVPGAEEHLGGEARAERQDQAGGSLRRAALIEGAAQHVEHHHAGDVADLAEALPRQVQPLGPQVQAVGDGPQHRWPAGVAENELQVARLTPCWPRKRSTTGMTRGTVARTLGLVAKWKPRSLVVPAMTWVESGTRCWWLATSRTPGAASSPRTTAAAAPSPNSPALMKSEIEVSSGW